MKTLFFECNMGASGDMLMAALCELLPDPDKFVNEQLNALNLPGIKISREYKFSSGIRGVHMRVEIHGKEELSHDHDMTHNNASTTSENHKAHDHQHEKHHHHVSFSDIRQLLDKLSISDAVKADTLAVYTIIAEAESKVHGCPVEEIHFHEVGALDAVADVLAVSMLMEKIGAEKIVCSPIHVGSGMVHCAHGLLPVPAPATAEILRGIPFYGGSILGELCTPTGAALLKHFVSSFGSMPVMTVEKIGIGVGSKEFSAANILRVFLGNSA